MAAFRAWGILPGKFGQFGLEILERQVKPQSVGVFAEQLANMTEVLS